MKRIGLILVAILLLAFPLFSQIVTIPDTAFLYALIDEGVDTNGDSSISYTEAEAIVSLDASSTYQVDGEWIEREKIKNMTGVEAFINLDTLRCVANEIDSLNLSASVELNYLDCSDNYRTLASLDVSGNLALSTLLCSNGDLKSLDV